MQDLPSGTVTFLFTDIESSTPLWDRDPGGMRESLARHDAILNESIHLQNGKVFRTVGDAFCAAFSQPGQAIEAALAAQRALIKEIWGSTGPLRVRMGIHTGPAEAQEGEYLSTHTLNRAQRVMSAGHGGQILASQSVVEVARGHLPAEVTWLDLGEHLLKGLSQPEHLFQVFVPDLPADFPPLQSSSAVLQNLPESLTPFVGRETEISTLSSILEGENNRLVTIHGMGGSGKTRLAIETGRRVLPNFQHGVWFIPLAPLDSAEQVPSAIIKALELSEFAGNEEKRFQLNYLRSKNILFILDNIEHLLPEAIPLLTEIFHKTSDVKLLVTSRERLNLPGEWIFELGGLDYPKDETAEELEGFGAVALFQQQLLRVRGSSWHESEKPCVRRICSLVQGIPLALELAAGWGRVLNCSEIAEEMKKSITFLETSSQGLPERQRSLKAAFDYSLRLLTEDERSVLKKLSVFRGGFVQEAAEKVAGANVFSLAALMDQALVERRSDGRYQLHELLRQYLSEHFDQPEREAVEFAHLEYFLHLAEKAEPLLRGAEQVQWLQKINADYDNIRSALDFAKEKDPYSGLRLASSVWLYWQAQAIEREGSSRLVDFMERVDAAGTVEWAYALSRTALLIGTDNYPKAYQLAQESLSLCLSFGDRKGEAFANFVMGWLEFQGMLEEDYKQAIIHFEESLGIYNELEDKWGRARSLFFLGHISDILGDRIRSKKLIERSLELFREFGDPRGISLALLRLAEFVFEEGNPSQAILMTEDGLLLRQELKAKGLYFHPLYLLSLFHGTQGDFEKGLVAAEEMLSLGRDLGEGSNQGAKNIGWGNAWLGWIATLRGDITTGKVLLEISANIFRKQDQIESLSKNLAWLGYTYGYLDEYDLAAEKLSESLARLPEVGPNAYMVFFYHFPFLGWIYYRRGEIEKAIEWYGKSFSQFKEKGSFPFLPSILEGFAITLASRSKYRMKRKWKEQAVLLIAAAEALRSQMGVHRPPVEREDFERSVEGLKASLGIEKYDSLYDRGSQLTREEALDLANSICQAARQ